MCSDEKILKKQINKKKNRTRSILTCIGISHVLLGLKEYFTCLPDEIDKIIYNNRQFIPLGAVHDPIPRQ